jgi:glycosyltransferase involved in cell wall biosynthesis
MATPPVSIVLPFRNAAATLASCLDSIAAQTLDDYEVLAIDDGSEDGSAEIVAARNDRRLCLLRPGRVGLVGALNAGIAAAGAPLLARMDADDLMHPERLACQCAFLDAHPEIALVGSQVALFPIERVTDGYREYVRWLNACVRADEIAAQIYVESPLAHPSVMLRRSALERVGPYADGPFPEDYELWLRLHHAGFLMAKIPQVLLSWREGENRTSRTDLRYSRTAFDTLRADYLARDPRLHRGFVIWGAGREARRRVRLLEERGPAPLAWIDVDPKKIGGTVANKPVHPMAWLIDADPRPLVLIYVTNHGARDAIAVALETWGYRPGDDYLAVG